MFWKSYTLLITFNELNVRIISHHSLTTNNKKLFSFEKNFCKHHFHNQNSSRLSEYYTVFFIVNQLNYF